MSRLLECLKTDILVADGAMGTLLYANGLDNCYEAYNLTHPDNISAIHQAYLEAGANQYLCGETPPSKRLWL